MLYGDWVGRWGRACPEREALVDVPAGRRYTYGDLAREVHRAARYLRGDLGVGRGDRVAVLALNRSETIVLFFAASRIGAILVPLNFRMPPGELAYLVGDARPTALFYDEANRAAAAALGPEEIRGRLVPLEGGAGAGSSGGPPWESSPDDPPPEVDIQGTDPQLIIYTSGTTGLPKGVILTHRMITANAVNTHIGWDLRADDRTVLHSALFYTAGWNIFTLPLFHCRGANVLIRGFDADLVLDLIARERLTVFFGVPTMYQMLLDSPRFEEADFSSMRFMVSGGAPLPRGVVEAFENRKGIHLREGYGLTEAGPNNFLADGKRGSVGHPMPHVDVKLVDDGGREVPPGQDGELLLRGEHLCAGYWNKPEESARAFEGGWFRTGDLARIDADGHLAIVGRKKDMFISGGINIYPAEIERVLERHPHVEEVAVIGVPDGKWGEVGKALVVLKAGTTLTLKEVAQFLQDRLGRYKIPKYLAVVPELPRTAASGKVQKFILQKRHGGADNE
jgi:fatty-acyl-CoA synthase